MSNPSVLNVVALYSSLKLFSTTSIAELTEKAQKLTGYLESLLDALIQGADTPAFQIITPRDPKQRGCQLSLLLNRNVGPIFDALTKAGIVVDKREPNCIRVAPVPLYNSFADVHRFVSVLRKVLQ